MNPSSSHILEELLELDPTLGSDPAFSRVVETMIECKPKVKLREGFETSLKREVLTQARLMQAKKSSWLLSWKTWSIFASGLAFASFAVFSALELNLFHKDAPVMMATLDSGGVYTTGKSAPEAAMMTPKSALSDSQIERNVPEMAATRNMSPATDDQTIVPETKREAQAPSAKTTQGNTETAQKNTESIAPRVVPPEALLQQKPAEVPNTEMKQMDALADSAESMNYGASADVPAAAPMMAKIAAPSIHFSYTKDLPDFVPLQTVVTLREHGDASQEITTKSPEVIKDELVSGGFYAKDFVFDNIVRELKNPRIETVIIEKNNEVYRVSALVLDVVDPAASGPKTVTVVLAEGF